MAAPAVGAWVVRAVSTVVSLFSSSKGSSGKGGARGGAASRHEGRVSALDKLWMWQAGADMVGRFWSLFDALSSQFHHVISVGAVGGPEADLRRLWYLVLAAAFGRYRNRADGIHGSQIECQWDITNKACSVTIGYTTNGLQDATIGGVGGVQPGTGGLSIIQRGPDQVTVGGSWPAFVYADAASNRFQLQKKVVGGSLINLIPGGSVISSTLDLIFSNIAVASGRLVDTSLTSDVKWTVTRVCNNTSPVPMIIFGGWAGRTANIFRELPNLVGSSGNTRLPWRRVAPDNVAADGASFRSVVNGLIPGLPDDGRVITTGERFDPRVQSPKPPIDGQTRGSIVQLVAQTLTEPCFLPESPKCTIAPLGSSGVRVYPPGQGLFFDKLNSSRFRQAVDMTIEELGVTLIAPAANALFLPSFPGPDGYVIPSDWNRLPNVEVH